MGGAGGLQSSWTWGCTSICPGPGAAHTFASDPGLCIHSGWTSGRASICAGPRNKHSFVLEPVLHIYSSWIRGRVSMRHRTRVAHPFIPHLRPLIHLSQTLGRMDICPAPEAACPFLLDHGLPLHPSWTLVCASTHLVTGAALQTRNGPRAPRPSVPDPGLGIHRSRTQGQDKCAPYATPHDATRHGGTVCHTIPHDRSTAHHTTPQHITAQQVTAQHATVGIATSTLNQVVTSCFQAEHYLNPSPSLIRCFQAEKRWPGSRTVMWKVTHRAICLGSKCVGCSGGLVDEDRASGDTSGTAG